MSTPGYKDFNGTEFKKNVWDITDKEFYKAYDDVFLKVGFFDYTLTNLENFKDWIYGDFLEVGCASGKTLRAVRSLCDRCVGVDVSKYALETARKELPKSIELQWGDVEKTLPFADKIFHTVLIGHTLEHLRNPARAISEIKRVCKDSIIVIIPLQGEDERWKKTNYHIQFWPTVESFEIFYGAKADKKLVTRKGTLATMLFKT